MEGLEAGQQPPALLEPRSSHATAASVLPDWQRPSSRRNSCLQEHEGCVVVLFYFFNISSMRKKKKNSLCFPFKL